MQRYSRAARLIRIEITVTTMMMMMMIVIKATTRTAKTVKIRRCSTVTLIAKTRILF